MASEMRLVGDEDGVVSILCERKGCMVQSSHGPVWLQISLAYYATPADVERTWMQHRLDHANREK